MFSTLLLYRSGSVVKSLVGHSGPVFSTAFSPDNTLLISASEDGTGNQCSVANCFEKVLHLMPPVNPDENEFINQFNLNLYVICKEIVIVTDQLLIMII